jgi:hypothetical protein
VLTSNRLGGVINKFRTTKLGLEPLTVRSGPGIVDRLKVPWTYCFSPELVHKPADWQNHIGRSFSLVEEKEFDNTILILDVVGFYFLNLASHYTPASDLSAFLATGPPPIYIG